MILVMQGYGCPGSRAAFSKYLGRNKQCAQGKKKNNNLGSQVRLKLLQ